MCAERIISIAYRSTDGQHDSVEPVLSLSNKCHRTLLRMMTMVMMVATRGLPPGCLFCRHLLDKIGNSSRKQVTQYGQRWKLKYNNMMICHLFILSFCFYFVCWNKNLNFPVRLNLKNGSHVTITNSKKHSRGLVRGKTCPILILKWNLVETEDKCQNKSVTCKECK